MVDTHVVLGLLRLLLGAAGERDVALEVLGLVEVSEVGLIDVYLGGCVWLVGS